jgi:hypothetical protein
MVQLFLVLLAGALLGSEDTSRLTKSLTSAAEAFLKSAPSFSAEETMRYRKAAGRDKWNAGSAVSEYGFKIDAKGVHERRKILRSSGGPDAKPTVNDAGQLLLLFESATIGRYEFRHTRTAYVGPQGADVFEYRQIEGPDTLTISERQKQLHTRTHGEVWVDSASYRLLRVTMDTERKDTRDHIEVDYVYTAAGAPMPVSALHREFHSDVVEAETLFSYRPLAQAGP